MRGKWGSEVSQVVPVDLEVYRSEAVYDGEGRLDHLYYDLVERESGERRRRHKVVKLVALDFLAKEAREEVLLVRRTAKALKGLYNAEVDFVYLVAGIFRPHVGIVQCYGVQGVGGSREEALERAREGAAALDGVMANFEQSRFVPLTMGRAEWLRRALGEMRFGLVGIGQPDPRENARGMSGEHGRSPTLDEYTLQQNELLYRGMAKLREEFVAVVMAFRVRQGDIYRLQAANAREASRWASMEKGTRGIHVGLSIPVILSGAFNAGASTGYGVSDTGGVTHSRGRAEGVTASEGYTRSVVDGQSHTEGHSRGVTETVGESVTTGHGVARGEAHTVGESQSSGGSWAVTETHGTAQTVGESHAVGQAHTEGVAQTQGQSHTVGHAETASTSQTTGQAHSVGTTITDGQSSGSNVGVSVGQSQSHSQGTSHGASLGMSASQSQEVGQSVQVGHTDGQSVADGSSQYTSEGHTRTVGVSASGTVGTSASGGLALGLPGTLGANANAGVHNSATVGGSLSNAHSVVEGEGTSHVETTSQSDSLSHGASVSQGASQGVSVGVTQGRTEGDTVGSSLDASVGASQGTQHSVAQSVNDVESHATTEGHATTASVADTVSSAETRSSSDTVSRTDATMRANTVSRSESVSRGGSWAKGTFASDTVSRVESDSVARTQSRATSVSETQSSADTVSHAEGEAWSEVRSRSRVESTGVAESKSTGVVQARSLATATGMGVGAGLAPSLSASKTYQWEDHLATMVADLLRGQERLLAEAATEGAFWVDAYFLCRTERGKQALAALYAQAFHGTEEVVTPAQTRMLTPPEERYVALHAQTFTPSTRREIVPGILEGYRDTSFLTLTQAAALVAPGCFEEGDALTVQEKIPPYAFPVDMPGDVVIGRLVSYETGDVTPAQCRLTRERMTNTAAFADTRFGKSVVMTWLEKEVALRWGDRVVVLDFGLGHRQLMNVIPRERFTLYGLYQGSPRPIRWNPLQIGRRIPPDLQLDATVDLLCNAGRMGERQAGWLWEVMRGLYLEHGVLTEDPQVLYPERYNKVVQERPDTPEARQAVALSHVSASEREVLNREREKPGLANLADGPIKLAQLQPWERQILAIERSKDVDLSQVYDRLEALYGRLRNNVTDQTAVKGLLLRLKVFRYGQLAAMYGRGEGSIAIEDLAYPDGVAVLEGGTMPEYGKAAILGLISWHLYNDAIFRARESIGQTDGRKLFLVYEEANKIISGVGEGAREDNGRRMTSDIYATMFRDAGKYGVWMGVIAQSPSELPPEIVSSCNNLFIGRLKNPRDRDLAVAALARSEKGFWYVQVANHIARLEVGRFVVLLGLSRDKKDVEPMLVETIPMPAAVPGDGAVGQRCTPS
ncbi:MAG: serine-rich protein [Chloroflexi bacterium]|nr:serine-rich protein [Chloroflexota bacterium]